MDRKNVFEISQQLETLSKTNSTIEILESIQNYILGILKTNPRNHTLIEHIKILENAKTQANLGIKPIKIFDDLCLKLIK